MRSVIRSSISSAYYLSYGTHTDRIADNSITLVLCEVFPQQFAIGLLGAAPVKTRIVSICLKISYLNVATDKNQENSKGLEGNSKLAGLLEEILLVKREVIR